MIENIKLVYPREFDKRFWQYVRECRTHKQAYQKTESDYRTVYDKNKYSSFESFRVARRVREKRAENQDTAT